MAERRTESSRRPSPIGCSSRSNGQNSTQDKMTPDLEDHILWIRRQVPCILTVLLLGILLNVLLMLGAFYISDCRIERNQLEIITISSQIATNASKLRLLSALHDTNIQQIKALSSRLDAISARLTESQQHQNRIDMLTKR